MPCGGTAARMEGSSDEVTLGVSCGRRREGGEGGGVCLSPLQERGEGGGSTNGHCLSAQEEQGARAGRTVPFYDLDLILN